MMRLYRRRDYKRRRTESSTFVPASYRPLFPGCNTVLYRPQEEYNDSSDSQSDSQSEFDDPAFWPEIFADEDNINDDSNTNTAIETGDANFDTDMTDKEDEEEDTENNNNYTTTDANLHVAASGRNNIDPASNNTTTMDTNNNNIMPTSTSKTTNDTVSGANFDTNFDTNFDGDCYCDYNCDYNCEENDETEAKDAVTTTDDMNSTTPPPVEEGNKANPLLCDHKPDDDAETIPVPPPLAILPTPSKKNVSDNAQHEVNGRLDVVDLLAPPLPPSAQYRRPPPCTNSVTTQLPARPTLHRRHSTRKVTKTDRLVDQRPKSPVFLDDDDDDDENEGT